SLPILLAGPRSQTMAGTLFDLWSNGQGTELAALGVIWSALMAMIAAIFYGLARRSAAGALARAWHRLRLNQSRETTVTTKKYETVLIEKQDGITWLIMNRPDKRNAMSPQLHLDMDDALAELAVDPETHVLVLTGAGEAFCAGQDIKLYFRASDDAPAARAKARHASNQWRWQRLSTFPMPTIAMVNGFCFGGGFTQVCACDFAIAADDAVFGLSEVNWGILPGGIVSWNVAQTLNFRDGMYYALTGDNFEGKKAN